MHSRNLQKPDASLKFLVVQADIDNQEKLASETGSAFRDVVIDKWIQGSQRGLESGPADYIVWPETAFPEVIDSSTLRGVYPMKLKAAILAGQTPLITGGYGVDSKSQRYTNSFFVIDKDGNWIDNPYHKTVLLAFGEYFPLGDQFPFLKRMFPEVGDYGRGPGPTVLNGGNGVRLGAQICYEGLFDWFTRGLAIKGAQLIVNLTNDAWYGSWEQPYQHAYMTFARAVEVRRPLIRSTNSGISGVALASGEILPLSPIYQVWEHTYDVPYARQPQDTIFMGWGFWLFPGILLLAFLSLFWSGFRNRD
jgi:apolipoprotein N-acyltransferase